MANRESRNVSLAPAQDQFVKAMVDGGHFRTASEVVREALRLLEEREHRRLLEKWIYQGLTTNEEARLPEALKKRARERFEGLLSAPLADVEYGNVAEGTSAMAKLRSELESQSD